MTLPIVDNQEAAIDPVRFFNYLDCSSHISNGYAECANRLINDMDMKGQGYSFETL